MAVPKFDEFLFPFISCLKEHDMTRKDIVSEMIVHFHLTTEDCTVKTKGGKVTQLNDRIGWALQYLRRALFVEIPQRGTYHLTERGHKYLQNNKDLRPKDLEKYPEFLKFAHPTVQSKSETTILKEAQEDTPTEILEAAFGQIQKNLSEELLAQVLEQSPQFFENLVLDLLLAMGYGNPQEAFVTPYVHDDGIDGIIPQDRLGLENIYIQAKRYQGTNVVGKPEIQKFSGALDEQNANKGVFITTSSFTKEAKLFVEKSSKHIVLIDGLRLTQYMIEYNVGVSTQTTYAIKKIDSDYFE